MKGWQNTRNGDADDECLKIIFDSKEKWEEPTDVSQDVEPLHYQRY